MWKLNAPSLSCFPNYRHHQDIPPLDSRWNAFHHWNKDKKGREIFKHRGAGAPQNVLVLRPVAVSSPPAGLVKNEDPRLFFRSEAAIPSWFLFKQDFKKSIDLAIDPLSATRPRKRETQPFVPSKHQLSSVATETPGTSERALPRAT